MSLNDLPEELVMKILGYLLDRDTCLQKDYMSLAMTCKRFFHLAENNFNLIKNQRSETSELAALHTYVVDANSRFQNRYIQNSTNICAAHSRHPWNVTPRCYYRTLSETLSSKHSIVRGIKIVGFSLDYENCLNSVDCTKLDYIVELVIIECEMCNNTLLSILLKFKNIVNLRLLGMHCIKSSENFFKREKDTFSKLHIDYRTDYTDYINYKSMDEEDFE